MFAPGLGANILVLYRAKLDRCNGKLIIHRDIETHNSGARTLGNGTKIRQGRGLLGNTNWYFEKKQNENRCLLFGFQRHCTSIMKLS